MTFDEIFDTLLVPRENGSAALEQIAAWIEKAARATGADVTVHEFTCYPHIHRLAGVVALLFGLALFAALWRRRFGAALALALAFPTYLLLEFEYYFPLLSRVISAPERNIVLSFPVADAARTIILGAHYDTKTDLLDHYQRAPIQFLLVPVILITFAIISSGWRRARHGGSQRGVLISAAAVAAYYVAFFLALSGGTFVSARSPGALDDGASVATLLKVAEVLGRGDVKLEKTDVKIVFFAGEEVGVQGSWRYAWQQLSGDPAHTFFINAEAVGYGPDLHYFTSDRFALHRYDASGELVRLTDRAARRATGHGITPDARPVITDARSFMAAGVPSICLSSARGNDDAVYGLHSARDSRERIDRGSLERALKFYEATLQEIDHS